MYLPRIVDVGDPLDDEEVVIAAELVPPVFQPFLARDSSLSKWL